MDTFLLLILIAFLGFFLFLFLIKKLRRIFISLPPIEFLFVGLIIGQPSINLFSSLFGINLPIILGDNNLVQLEPTVVAVLGIVGFFVGARFRVKEFLNFQIDIFKLSILYTLLTFGFLSGISFVLMNTIFHNALSFENILVNSLLIGTTGSIISPSMFEVVRNKFTVSGNNFNVLTNLPKINNFIVLTLLGLLLTFFNSKIPNEINLTATEWFVLNIAVGFALGFLFFLFIEKEESEITLLVALIGIIIFTSGVAYLFNFSPLFVNMLTGFVIGNLVKSKESLTELFNKLEHPVWIIILLYAGISLRFAEPIVFVSGLLLYIIINLLIKYLNGWICYHISTSGSGFSPRIGSGLTSQGLVTLIIIINFQLVLDNILINTLFAIVVFAIIINEVISLKLTKDLLIDLGEIK